MSRLSDSFEVREAARLIGVLWRGAGERKDAPDTAAADASVESAVESVAADGGATESPSVFASPPAVEPEIEPEPEVAATEETRSPFSDAALADADPPAPVPSAADGDQQTAAYAQADAYPAAEASPAAASSAPEVAEASPVAGRASDSGVETERAPLAAPAAEVRADDENQVSSLADAPVVVYRPARDTVNEQNVSESDAMVSPPVAVADDRVVAAEEEPPMSADEVAMSEPAMPIESGWWTSQSEAAAEWRTTAPSTSGWPTLPANPPEAVAPSWSPTVPEEAPPISEPAAADDTNMVAEAFEPVADDEFVETVARPRYAIEIPMGDETEPPLDDERPEFEEPPAAERTVEEAPASEQLAEEPSGAEQFVEEAPAVEPWGAEPAAPAAAELPPAAPFAAKPSADGPFTEEPPAAASFAAEPLSSEEPIAEPLSSEPPSLLAPSDEPTVAQPVEEPAVAEQRYRGDRLEDVLRRASERGDLRAVVVTDRRGFLLAAHNSPVSDAALAAATTVLAEAVEKAAVLLQSIECARIAMAIDNDEQAELRRFFVGGAPYYLLALCRQTSNDTEAIQGAIEEAIGVLSK